MRHDPEARSSREADRLARGLELPLREDEDDEGPPVLDDDAETGEHGEDDFRSADGDDEGEDENYSNSTRKSFPLRHRTCPL